MKAIKFSSLLVAVLALLVAATGCQKKPVGVTQIPGRGYKVGDAPPQPPGGTIGDQPPGEIPIATPMNPKTWIKDGQYTDNAAELAVYKVHFDYDSSVIRSSERANVDAVAAYMKSNAGLGLRIDGHCDERGTEEYNRSLGERRALALREALIAEGVEADLVITQSFGEDKPEVPGHDESAWSKNRRGEFVVLHPK
jgi:peptidoglycan-associated lipoprotein